jgi:hypothetical protein
MQIIQHTLSKLSLGHPQFHASLGVFPLLAPEGDPEEMDYLTLDEALQAGRVHVSETSEAGSVPELLLENTGEKPVLLADGEELVGAKQNRVLNLSILAPAVATVVIPVSCVEAGRWRHTSTHFRTEGRAHFAEGRAAKAEQVTASLRERGSYRSDQGAVWDAIERKSMRMRSRSETAAMSRIYEDHDLRLQAYDEAFATVPRQVGAVFAIGGEIRGLELFDFPVTFARLFPKLLKSYALDALEWEEDSSPPSEAIAQGFLHEVALAEGSRHRARGEGEDIRLHNAGLAGGALEARGRLVHLYAFRRPAEGTHLH